MKVVNTVNVDIYIVVHWYFGVYIMLWICKLIIFYVNCILTNRTNKMWYDLKEIWYYLTKRQRMSLTWHVANIAEPPKKS